jgi:hypothetical protein
MLKLKHICKFPVSRFSMQSKVGTIPLTISLNSSLP